MRRHTRWLGAGLAVALLASGLKVGLHAQSTPPDPARFESAIAAWEAEDAAHPPPEGAIVFVGSSSIRFWSTVHEDMAPLTVIHRGFGGSWMQDAIHYVDRIVTNYRPRAVVLYEGDNDVGGGGLSPEKLLDGFQTFVARVHATLPEARIYFLAIKPSLLRWDDWAAMREANRLVEAETKRDVRLMFIDVATPMLGDDGRLPEDLFVRDRLHLTPKGYVIWTHAVRPVLMAHEARFEH